MIYLQQGGSVRRRGICIITPSLLLLDEKVGVQYWLWATSGQIETIFGIHQGAGIVKDQCLSLGLESFHSWQVIKKSDWPEATHLVTEGLITSHDLKSAAVRTLKEENFTPEGVFTTWEMPIRENERNNTCLHIWSHRIPFKVKSYLQLWAFSMK